MIGGSGACAHSDDPDHDKTESVRNKTNHIERDFRCIERLVKMVLLYLAEKTVANASLTAAYLSDQSTPIPLMGILSLMTGYSIWRGSDQEENGADRTRSLGHRKLS